MKGFIILSLLFLSGCASALPLVEPEQLNTLPLAALTRPADEFKNWVAPPPPKEAILVKAKIVDICDYSKDLGAADSLSMYPHLLLKLKIVDGKLPAPEKNNRYIDYHLYLHPTRKFHIGQVFTFIFTPDDQFYGVKEIKPIQELSDESPGSQTAH